MPRPDPHSYADPRQGRTRSFDWNASVDFEARVLRAHVALQLDAPSDGGPLDLDTRGLELESVSVPHTLHPADPILGARLELKPPRGTTEVSIRYRTRPDASALQWLKPAQTHGGKEPFLFSQCQAIHARSVVPCQDTPGIRQTYTASLEVPAHLKAVMAAAPGTRTVRDGRARETFHMPQPIPPYLLAFAVGDLSSRELSPRSRVWTEPGMLDAAAWEFAEVEQMMKAAEQLFGPYDWERFDLLVMPPSFPYGGMENPRLTFLTPALLAKDRSLVSVVAHELAHAWTGNLVTNLNAEHFWLNEGFTVFAENRILETLEGADVAALHSAVGHQELLKAFEQFKERPQLTRLRTHLEGVDPDEAFSVVPYIKGYLFLKTLEQAAGRSRFDGLLKRWLERHRFGAATTDDFVQLVEAELPGVLERVNSVKWLDGPGLPEGHWQPRSALMEAVVAQAGRVPSGASGWTVEQWQLWFETAPRPFASCAQLQEQYRLGAASNMEILVGFLTLAAESAYAPALPLIEEVLGRVGRMKYLKPLYRALARNPGTRPKAQELFDRFKERYHPIAQQVIGGVLRA